MPNNKIAARKIRLHLRKTIYKSFVLFCFIKFSLCSSGYPGTHDVDKAVLQLTAQSTASASQIQGLKACTRTPIVLHFQKQSKGMFYMDEFTI